MKLPKSVVRAGAIASFLVTAGANSDVHAFFGAGVFFTLSFPGASVTVPAGQPATVTFDASYTSSLTANGNNLFPECCEPLREGDCFFYVAETGDQVQGLLGITHVIAPNRSLPSSPTPGRVLTYHVFFTAHCSFIQAGSFFIISQDPETEAIFRVTSK